MDVGCVCHDVRVVSEAGRAAQGFFFLFSSACCVGCGLDRVSLGGF